MREEVTTLQVFAIHSNSFQSLPKRELKRFVIGRSWVQLPLSAPDFSNLLAFLQFTFPLSAPTENPGTHFKIHKAASFLQGADGPADHKFRWQDTLAESHSRVMQALEKHLHARFADLFFVDADG